MSKNPMRRPHGRAEDGLPRPAVWLFAVAAGLGVANIYYAQPLLDVMAQDFGIQASAVGLVVTLTQVGYALGLIFVVPLGDLVDRRRMIVGMSLLSAGALALAATAETSAILFAALMATGVLAVVVQVLEAFAATLASPGERGKVVGGVTSGVVAGILGARFVAGLIADWGGWRAVYLTSAALAFAMAVLLLRFLPTRTPRAGEEDYASVLRSIPVLFLSDRVLLRHGLLALLIFAAFATLWTALVLPLRAEPFSYSHTRIGLFGLAGMAGALAASQAGRLADRGLGERTTGWALMLLTASWGGDRPRFAFGPASRRRRDPLGSGGTGGPRHQPEHHPGAASAGRQPSRRRLHGVLLGRQRPRGDRLHNGLRRGGLDRRLRARGGGQCRGPRAMGRRPRESGWSDGRAQACHRLSARSRHGPCRPVSTAIPATRGHLARRGRDLYKPPVHANRPAGHAVSVLMLSWSPRSAYHGWSAELSRARPRDETIFRSRRAKCPR